MGVSLRHVYRLKNNLTKEGPKGLVSKKVGAPSNHQMYILFGSLKVVP
jgi:hypothetical protein